MNVGDTVIVKQEHKKKEETPFEPYIYSHIALEVQQFKRREQMMKGLYSEMR